MRYLLLLLALPLVAQTTITVTTQARVDPVATGTRVLLFHSAGTAIAAQLDAARLILDMSTTPPTLRVIGAGAARVYGEALTLVAGSKLDYTLSATPKPGTLAVWINGLRGKPTLDYTMSGMKLSLVAALDAPGNIVVVDYDR